MNITKTGGISLEGLKALLERAKINGTLDRWVETAVEWAEQANAHIDELNRRAPSAEQLEVLRRVWQPHTQSNVDRMSEKGIAEEISCAVESAEQQSDQLSLDGEGGVTRRRDAEQQRQEPVADERLDNAIALWNQGVAQSHDLCQLIVLLLQERRLYTHQQPQALNSDKAILAAAYKILSARTDEAERLGLEDISERLHTAARICHEESLRPAGEQPQVQGGPDEFAEIEALAAQIAGMLPSQQMAHAAAALRKKITDVRWRRLFGQPRAAVPDVLREKIVQLIDEIEDTEEHGQGAFEDTCSICTLMQEIQNILAAAPAQPGDAQGGNDRG